MFMCAQVGHHYFKKADKEATDDRKVRHFGTVRQRYAQPFPGAIFSPEIPDAPGLGPLSFRSSGFPKFGLRTSDSRGTLAITGRSQKKKDMFGPCFGGSKKLDPYPVKKNGRGVRTLRPCQCPRLGRSFERESWNQRTRRQHPGRVRLRLFQERIKGWRRERKPRSGALSQTLPAQHDADGQ